MFGANDGNLTPLGLSFKVDPDSADTLRQKHSDGRVQLSQKLLRPSTAVSTASLPRISLEVEQLIGYQPQSDEVDSIRESLVQTMWGRFDDVNAETGALDMSVPPPDFDEHATEMMNSGVAQFFVNEQQSSEALQQPQQEDTKSQDTVSNIVLVYPPTLKSPSSDEIVRTGQVWRETCNRCSKPSFERSCRGNVFPGMERLLQYLLECNHGLFWKSDMSVELQRLWMKEQTHLEYLKWRESERQIKLDRLYEVRETIQHQLELSDQRLEVLDKERSDAMAAELRRQRIEASGNPFAESVSGMGGLQGFDFESTIMSFPSEFKFLSLNNEPSPDDEDSWGLNADAEEDDNFSGSDSDDNDGEDNDGDVDDEKSADPEQSDGGDGTSSRSEHKKLTIINDGYNPDSEQPDTNAARREAPTKDVPKLISPSHDEEEEAAETQKLSIGAVIGDRAFKRRKHRAKQRRRQARIAEKEERHKTMLEGAMGQEKAVSEMCTKPEYIIANSMNKALNEKMEKLDDLLETLQDEVWEAEEDSHDNLNSTEPSDEMPSPESFSLLDQILAMILGALSPHNEVLAGSDHLSFIQHEHREIVQEWKDYFGRLPPPITEATDLEEPSDTEAPQKENSATPSIPAKELTPAEHRELLGIVGNSTEDWEDNYDEDD